MNLGRVIGTLVATRKDDSLIGSKLMITQPLDIDYNPVGDPFIAVDTVGAGIGEVIIYAEGTASRNAAKKHEAAIDAAIIGIVDNMDVYKDVLER
ncbi:ethanolamine utilization EutN/carboxysome family protein [Gottschalkia purinilytica]|uniref:Ethanolamine utilization EutN/carboxysome family protein n=1 Tax=Gottschalkia purinilytica TaxID=1503 RepID=A0A0L0W693_GOTPU|nr:EutN/CcmL family microcompartment protein [Gottschalkia purinilytica]KNF07039.1 ethanolamine utilization EutN/carboxysome family protein [Gottschalkia purinilytica]